jgi:hypothetical protein
VLDQERIGERKERQAMTIDELRGFGVFSLEESDLGSGMGGSSHGGV